ncbi:MAG TPA: chaperone modulator CbpM [Gammaproteobacteria bacterium]|nr:chaperone modulator CbpM [Gammaproteobacteria bacterium]
MDDEDALIGTLLEDACLRLEDLAAACAVPPEWVIRRVQWGLLSAPGEAPAHWRFTSRDLCRARRMHALERDFEAVPELAALMADLLDDLETLRARLRRAERG